MNSREGNRIGVLRTKKQLQGIRTAAKVKPSTSIQDHVIRELLKLNGAELRLPLRLTTAKDGLKTTEHRRMALSAVLSARGLIT